MRLLKQIWMILTVDCEDSARLTSESMDRPLNWAETMAVHLHRLICAKSRRLNRQMIQLNVALRRSTTRANPIAADSSKSLSTDARARIRQAIKDAQE